MCHWFPILFPISFRIFEVFGFVCTFCWKMKQQKCIEAFSIIITFERSVLMQFRCKTPHSRIIFCSELSEEVVPNVLNDEVKEWNRVKQRRTIAAGICHKAIRPIIRLTFPRFASHHFTYFPGQQLFIFLYYFWFRYSLQRAKE